MREPAFKVPEHLKDRIGAGDDTAFTELGELMNKGELERSYTAATRWQIGDEKIDELQRQVY